MVQLSPPDTGGAIEMLSYCGLMSFCLIILSEFSEWMCFNFAYFTLTLNHLADVLIQANFVCLKTIFVWQFEWLVGGLPSTRSRVHQFEMRSPAVLSNDLPLMDPPAESAGLFAVCSIYLLRVWGRENWTDPFSVSVEDCSLTFHKAKVFCSQ